MDAKKESKEALISWLSEKTKEDVQSGVIEPCPFCKTDSGVVCQHSSYFQVDCRNCDASGPISEIDSEDAIRLWNEGAL